MDAGDPPALELKRHPGAGRLVGSGAIDDHLPIAGDLGAVLVKLLRRDPAAAGYRIGGGHHVQRCTKIDDCDVFPSVEPPLETSRR